MRKLTGKQQVFVTEYCNNGYNGFQAAKKAGYKGNDNTLAVVAHENLNKPNIKAVIADYQAKLRKKAEYNREEADRCLVAALNDSIVHNDRTNQIAAIKERNVIYGLRTENINIKGDERPVISPEREAELKKITDIMAKDEIEKNRRKIKITE